jgi:hypothetical protein
VDLLAKTTVNAVVVSVIPRALRSLFFSLVRNKKEKSINKTKSNGRGLMIVHREKFVAHVELYDLDVAGEIRSFLSESSEENRDYRYQTIVESATGEGGVEMDVNALMKDYSFMKELENTLENTCE